MTMKLSVCERIGHPAPRVLRALRDHIHELAHLMPNMDGMENIIREERPPVTYMHNRWQGSKDSLPAPARPFVSKNVVAWFDHAEWNAETYVCTWRIEPVIGKSIFECAGTTAIIGDGNGACDFTLDANLTLYLDRVPGLPRFMARRVQDPVERFIANQMRPNLGSLAHAVTRYLDQQDGQEK